MTPTPRRRGFTLVEIIVTMMIVSLFVAGLAGFIFVNYDSYFTTLGRLRVNRDIRTFTQSMTEEARNADSFDILTSYTDRTRQTDGGRGDFLVLYFRNNAGALERIVGYYREQPAATAEDPNPPGPVRRFEVTGTTPTLPATSETGHEVVWELARGLSDNRLFYNFYGRSIMIRGEIQHQGTLRRRVGGGMNITNTYNFTVSPRS